jgi:hypothetical protein
MGDSIMLRYVTSLLVAGVLLGSLVSTAAAGSDLPGKGVSCGKNERISSRVIDTLGATAPVFRSSVTGDSTATRGGGSPGVVLCVILLVAALVLCEAVEWGECDRSYAGNAFAVDDGAPEDARETGVTPETGSRR